MDRFLGGESDRNAEVDTVAWTWSLADRVKSSREIGFQPILLVVLLRRIFKVRDHLIDIVFDECLSSSFVA